MVSFGVEKKLPDVIVINGPSGSGKSAITSVFMTMLVDEQNLTPPQAERWLLPLDALDYAKDFHVMWTKISKFVESPIEFIKAVTCTFRVCVIDNMQVVPPSSQMFLKKVMDICGIGQGKPKLKFIFVCNNPKVELIGYIQTKALMFRTRVIAEKECLLTLMFMCFRMSIGYEREGLKEVFNISKEYSLSSMMDLMQKVFVATHYISAANVLRVSGVKRELQAIPPIRAMEPLERCKVCTLYPPCNHTTYDDLVDQGTTRRAELPRYRYGSMTCPTFQQHGFCPIFNKYGHCSLDHPKNLHKVLPAKRFCAQCTIPWPCGHCAYTVDRNSLLATIAELQARIVRVRQINVPEPPLSMVRHLMVSDLI